MSPSPDIAFELPDDIINEFTVDTDGKVFAKSIRGIARVCGCYDSSIHRILENLVLREKLSEPLKPFSGMDLKVLPGGYSDLFVAACAKHFAMYAQVTNATAIRNDALFSAIGARTCFQVAKGWKQKSSESVSAEELKSMFSELMKQNAELMKQGRATQEKSGQLESEVKEFRQMQEQANAQPGLKFIITELAKTNNLLESGSYSLRQFIEQQEGFLNLTQSKSLNLTDTEVRKVALRAGHTYRVHNQSLPNKRYHKKYGKVNEYTAKDRAMLQAAYTEVVAERNLLK